MEAAAVVSAEMPLERLEAEICELAGHLAAGECRWLLLLSEFDRREGWAGWGMRSCAHWVSYRCGIGLQAAREKLRVGRRLGELPLVREAFAAGELSYSKARAVCRVARPETEPTLLEMARYATTAQLEEIVRTYRAVTGRDELRNANDRHDARFVRWHWDDDGSLVLTARLSPEDGAVVLAALEAGRAAMTEDFPRPSSPDAVDDSAESSTTEGRAAVPPPALSAAASGDSAELSTTEGRAAVPPAALSAAASGDSAESFTTDGRAAVPPAALSAAASGDSAESFTTEGRAAVPTAALSAAASRDSAESPLPEISNADALVAVANLALAAPARSAAPVPEVVIVERATLSGDVDQGRCYIDGAASIPPETARRLACDATVVAMIEAANGTPLDVGRKRRTPPTPLRRALRRRDRGCRFPGCGNRRFVHAHHIVHWINGGETKLTNLILLCGHHHRLVHEGGYRIEILGDHVFAFLDRGGRPVPEAPAPTPTAQPDLPERNEALGLGITPETCRSLGGGEPYDLGITIDVLVAA